MKNCVLNLVPSLLLPAAANNVSELFDHVEHAESEKAVELFNNLVNSCAQRKDCLTARDFQALSKKSGVPISDAQAAEYISRIDKVTALFGFFVDLLKPH